MRIFISIIPAILFVVSCGPSQKAVDTVTPEEQVELGYGKISKKNNTYSVSSLKPRTNDVEGYSNIYDYLRGRVAGVEVGPDNTVHVRGISTINGSSEPIYIVNGIEVETIDNIPPIEVSSITVLKDASSSIYGARGGNGVIIIELKH